MSKLLLMGPQNAGKTCMRSIIFDNYLPRDAKRLEMTIQIDQSQVHILRNLSLNLWDCGGQRRYINEYLQTQNKYIFSNVAVLLFVFDLNNMCEECGEVNYKNSYSTSHASPVNTVRTSGGNVNDNVNSRKNNSIGRKSNSSTISNIDFASDSGNLSNKRQEYTSSSGRHNLQPQNLPASFARKSNGMIDYFKEVMLRIAEHSPKAKKFVLLHKIDLIDKSIRDRIIEERKAFILQSIGPIGNDVQFFATTIWSDSLFLAYSAVVRSLIPHREVLVNVMREISVACNAVEVALYEQSTFLCLAHVSNSVNSAGECTKIEDSAESRTTEVSEIIKHFKWSCMNHTTTFDDLHIKTNKFTALLQKFTECTVVLVICNDPTIHVKVHKMNVNAQLERFSRFLNGDCIEAREMREMLEFCDTVCKLPQI